MFRSYVRAHLGAELPERIGEAPYLVFDAWRRPHFIREANRPSELVWRFFSRSGDVTKDSLRLVLQAVRIEPLRQENNLMDNVVHMFVWMGALISITVVGVSLAWLAAARPDHRLFRTLPSARAAAMSRILDDLS